MLPLLEWEYIRSNRVASLEYSVFLNGNTYFLPSGRVALYEALRLSGVCKHSEVLVPSYHCGSMIEPVVHHNATPVFYKLDKELLVSFESIKSSITTNTKAIIVPHFFGFQQNIREVKAICEPSGVKVIEDCAHSLYGKSNSAKLPGSQGDIAISSTVKFIPGTHGGALKINSQTDLSLVFRSPSFWENVKDAKRILERKNQFSKKASIEYKSILENAELLHKETMSTNSISFNNYFWFDSNEIGLRNSAINVWLVKHSQHDKIIGKRIENYRHYERLFKEIEGVSFLHDSLGNAVPYVFPLILENPEKHFHKLKLMGVPIWRWEELVVTSCSTANNYRHKLLQLPIHQSINRSDIEWIADCFNQVTSNSV